MNPQNIFSFRPLWLMESLVREIVCDCFLRSAVQLSPQTSRTKHTITNKGSTSGVRMRVRVSRGVTVKLLSDKHALLKPFTCFIGINKTKTIFDWTSLFSPTEQIYELFMEKKNLDVL